MTYLPLEIFERRPSNAVTEMAFAIPDSTDQGPFLFTGGPNPLAVRLAGAGAGQGIEIVKHRPQEMLVVTGIELEIDTTFRQKSGFVEEPVGAILVGKAAKGITANYTGRRGVTELVTAYFDRDPEDSLPDNGTELVFPRWRIVKRVEQEAYELARFEAEKIGDR